MKPISCVMAAALSAALAGCGGGEFAESFVRLISARFVPAGVTLPRGATRTVVFEVTCDSAALDTPFGRLGLRVKLDPQRRLPGGLSASLATAGPTDSEGFTRIPCNGAHTDPDLRIAQVSVQLQAAADLAPMTATLTGYVEIEPLITGEPSKDSTQADLAITVSGGEGTSPG